MGTKKLSRLKKIENKLSELEVGDSFCVKEFVDEHWEVGYDYFTVRSFTVILSRAKKSFPEREFGSIKKRITRLK